MRFPTEPIADYDLSSLRVLGSVGEPINPEAWRWLYQHVGRSKCTIVDTYWQTETGAHIATNLPGSLSDFDLCIVLMAFAWIFIQELSQ